MLQRRWRASHIIFLPSSIIQLRLRDCANIGAELGVLLKVRRVLGIGLNLGYLELKLWF